MYVCPQILVAANSHGSRASCCSLVWHIYNSKLCQTVGVHNIFPGARCMGVTNMPPTAIYSSAVKIYHRHQSKRSSCSSQSDYQLISKQSYCRVHLSVKVAMHYKTTWQLAGTTDLLYLLAISSERAGSNRTQRSRFHNDLSTEHTQWSTDEM